MGTATAVGSWLLVEWPLPWPPDAAEIPALAEVAHVAEGKGARLQLVVPQSTEDKRTVVSYRRRERDGWFSGFEPFEVWADEHAVVEVALGLLSEPTQRVPRGAGDEGNRPAHRIALVCTHGSRDVCCGSKGARVASEMLDDPRILRTSHLGGHRFAPTVLVLPEGTLWAWMDAQTVRRVLDRRGDPRDVVHHLRGCTALTPPQVQAVDVALFSAHGWSWLDWDRRGEMLDEERVRFEARSPDGRVHAWTAKVSRSRSLPVPVCPVGEDPAGGATKFEDEFEVEGLEKADPTG
ncbi:MAG: hypothetical protein KatS3mg008_1453 [Acidimicrobiales bacterium]|nr:MAG: hypothetical protein KatS3mg008_1453 [Acidimicrobiales bacterium]